MHGMFRSEVGEDLSSWQAALVPSAPYRTKEVTPLQRSDYCARRANWPLIAFILAAHGVLLAALILFDVIPISKPRVAPTVVTLIELQVEPPPRVPVEKVPPSEKVQPHFTAPVQVVQPPIAPVMPLLTPEAPPAPPVIALPAPVGPVAVGDLSSKMIRLVAPRYPLESRRRKEQGTVYLLVTLGVDGAVADIRISRSSGYERLDKAAFDAVRRWRWSPTIRNDEAVPVQGTVDIPFTLTA